MPKHADVPYSPEHSPSYNSDASGDNSLWEECEPKTCNRWSADEYDKLARLINGRDLAKLNCECATPHYRT